MFPGRAIVFDLDDTLYPERSFVDSGFRAVLGHLGLNDDQELLERMWGWQHDGQPVFDTLVGHLGSLGTQAAAMELLEVYRFHEPCISLSEGAERLLQDIRLAGGRLGIVTDGRSRTQRAKIRALGLGPLIDVVVISEEIGSEKPDPRNFEIVIRALRGHDPVYLADNPRKDFIAPNALGWKSVMVMGDEGNTHRHMAEVGPEAEPQIRVKDLTQIRVGATSSR